ncbi:MAG TPA: response regulator [Polyangiales bacterium]|nr:response regulator [Polyangiales bacterium]
MGIDFSDEPSAPKPNRPQPLAAELHAQRVDAHQSSKLPEIDLELSSIVVTSADPFPPGSVVSINLRLSNTAPAITTLARVASVDPPAIDNGPSTMHLSLLEVWGKRAAEQLTQYMAEANTTGEWRPILPSSVRVLVVDDNEHYRERAAKVMREAGFEVIVASNGFEGLSAALKYQPSVVLSDVQMPGMDGWALLRMIRARPTLRRTPVLFLTDLSSEEQRLRGYELGVDDYVAKPFTSVELIARVERILERVNMTEDAVANGMRGDLSKIPLSSLLSFAELERRTGILQLECEREGATLHLREGSVMRIDLGEEHNQLEGIERFFHVLEWQSGRFELSSGGVFAEDVLNLPTTYVLLEHARRRDEQARG